MGLNLVILEGHLGNDPDLQEKTEGKEMVRFNLATNDEYPGQKKPEWHKIVAFGKLALVCSKYLKKGGKALLQGRNQTREYEKEGQKHFITEVVVQKVHF